MWVAWLVACEGGPDGAPETDEPSRPAHTAETGDTEPPTETDGTAHTGAVTGEPVITAGPTVSPPDAPQLRLAQVLTVSTDVATEASLVIDDGARRRRVTFPGRSTDHALPVLELRQATDYDLELTLTDAEGHAVVASASFSTALVPELLPRFEVLADAPSAEGHLHVLTAEGAGVPTVIAVADRSGQAVWAAITGAETKSVSFEPSTGRLSWLSDDALYRMNAAGQDAVTYNSERGRAPGAIEVPLPAFHHEAAIEADGSFWTFHKENVKVPAYPVSELTPLLLAPAVVAADVVAHVAADGTVLGTWPLADLFPTERIGYYGVEDTGAHDWTHSNAIVPLPGEDAFLVSMRHQDAVARVRISTGEVEWILANHDGWPPSHQPLLLTPVGDPFSWAYHQHAPAVDASGGVWMFDNGNEHRTTPYSRDPQPGPDYSRVVRYEVDPTARTVRQTFSFANDAPFPMYSNLLGNADPLPRSGHVVVTFPALYEEDGVDNEAAGRGARSTRIREIDPDTGEVVYDLRVSSAAADLRGGYLTDRAIAIPSLYAEDVVVEWLD